MTAFDLALCQGTTESLKKRIDKEVKRQLQKQKESWKDSNIDGILRCFRLEDLNTAFFIRRNEFRKRSNLSLVDQFLIDAPSNVELRMPVALKRDADKIILYDLYGKLEVKIEKNPEYALEEDKIYIMKLTKHYPMYQNEIVLGENRNGYELYLKPTPLPLMMQPDEESDYDWLRKVPERIESVEEAIDIINGLQNRYRLMGYYVERKDEITIIVDGEECFVVAYRKHLKTLAICILYDIEKAS